MLGTYEVQLVVNDGTADSTPVSVYVATPAPEISSQPGGGLLEVGQSFQTRITATGVGELSYQWRHNGNPVGIDSPTLEIGYVLEENAGVYTCTVTNPNGATTSTPARLVVVEGVPAASGLGLLLAVVGIILGAVLVTLRCSNRANGA